MRHSRKTMRCILIITVAGILAAPLWGADKPVKTASAVTKQASPANKQARPAPATRPALTRPAGPQAPDPKAAAAVSKAAAALTKEFQEHQKDPLSPLRKASNYFKEKADEAGDLTPEAILGGLEKRQNPDQRIDAYVKWQLLSGLKERFDARLAYRAMAVYQHAPRPMIRPGTDDAEKRQLHSALPQGRIENSEVADDLNREWKERVYRAAQANEHVIAYRNELFTKLPLTAATLRAGLEDAYTRVMNGTSSDKFFELILSPAIREWANAANPADLRQIANLVVGVQGELTGKSPKSPEYFTQVRYDEKKASVNWEKGRATFAQVKEIDELVGYLQEQAQRSAAAKK